MVTRRFYSPTLGDGPLQLDQEQSAHARRVLRLNVGDTIELFNGAGDAVTARITDARKKISVESVERRHTPRLSPWIDVAVAVPKGGRADVMVEKASELGADRLIPLTTARGVVDPRGGKLGRFKRIAIESAKQCGRPWLLEIDRPITFEKLLANADHDLKLIADTATHADQPAPDIATILQQTQRGLILIGPEGGWTDHERQVARQASFSSWRLGPYVMRIETAAAAALAILRQSP